MNEAQRGADDADQVVGPAHHSLTCLIEWNQADVTTQQRSQVDVLLRGHLHAIAPAFAEDPG